MSRRLRREIGASEGESRPGPAITVPGCKSCQYGRRRLAARRDPVRRRRPSQRAQARARTVAPSPRLDPTAPDRATKDPGPKPGVCDVPARTNPYWTVSVPVMFGWTSQKNWYVPAAIAGTLFATLVPVTISPL